ncbi:hypothetical protein KIW84_012519 [Lathyrus oleraceus]|uniref:Uncharacterized protein n=1 Tax=Pisum sativum TaxID=3888 RepID=A0A9D5BHX4_PEA|nr:hypothetical protein KIW84_012519 [Pisum sativum]
MTEVEMDDEKCETPSQAVETVKVEKAICAKKEKKLSISSYKQALEVVKNGEALGWGKIIDMVVKADMFGVGYQPDQDSEAIVKEEKGQRGRTREQRLEKSLELRDFAGLTQTVIDSVFGLVVKFRTYSFLRNRNRRSGSPPTAENAENSAFCLVLAQELLFCLR